MTPCSDSNLADSLVVVQSENPKTEQVPDCMSPIFGFFYFTIMLSTSALTHSFSKILAYPSLPI